MSGKNHPMSEKRPEMLQKSCVGEGIRGTADLIGLGVAAIDADHPLHPEFQREFIIDGIPFSSVLHYVYSQFILGFGLAERCTISWIGCPQRRFREFVSVALFNGWLTQDDLDLFDTDLWGSCVETAYKAKLSQDEDFNAQLLKIAQLVPVVVGKGENSIGVGMSTEELGSWMVASGHSAEDILRWTVVESAGRPRELGANRVGEILYRFKKKSRQDAQNAKQFRLEHDYSFVVEEDIQEEPAEQFAHPLIDPTYFLNTSEEEIQVVEETLKGSSEDHVGVSSDVPQLSSETTSAASEMERKWYESAVYQDKSELTPTVEQTDSESDSDIQPVEGISTEVHKIVDPPLKPDVLPNSDTSDDDESVEEEENEMDVSSPLEPYLIDSVDCCLHDWHRCPFTDEGVTYQTVRQYVHYHLLMRMGWEYSFFADASLQSLQLILSAKSPAECTSKTVELLDLFCQQTGLEREAMGIERHLRPLLRKAYRLKLSAWPQIRQSLVDTGSRVIVRLDRTPPGDLWEKRMSSGFNSDDVDDSLTQRELRRLSHADKKCRNLVGGVLMKLRELLGVPLIDVVPVKNVVQKEIHNVDTTRLQGFCFITPDNQLSTVDPTSFMIDYQRYGSLLEFCMIELLTSLGVYDGPLENNSRELRSQHGDPMRLENIVESVMIRNPSLVQRKAQWINECLFDCLLRAARHKFRLDPNWQGRILSTGYRLLLSLPTGANSLPLDIGRSSEEFLDRVATTNVTEVELLEQMQQRGGFDTGANLWGLALMQIREVLHAEREEIRKRQEAIDEQLRLEMEARLEQQRIAAELEKEEEDRKLKELVEESVKAEIKRLTDDTSVPKSVDMSMECENLPKPENNRELLVDKSARKIVVVKKKPVEPPLAVPEIGGSETDGVAKPLIDRGQKKIVIRRHGHSDSCLQQPTEPKTKLSSLERLKSLNFTSKFSFGDNTSVPSDNRGKRQPFGAKRNVDGGETELISTADYRLYPKRPKVEETQLRGAFPIQKEQLSGSLNISKAELDQMSEKQLESLVAMLRDKQSGGQQSSGDGVGMSREIVGNPVSYRSSLYTPFD